MHRTHLKHLAPGVALWTGVILCGGGLRAWAHDGPEDEVAEITEQIAARGESADLLMQRAIEYRVVGKNAEAAKDLERATKLEPELLLAQRELGRVYFALGKTNEALDTVTHALRSKAPEQEAEVAALHMLRAEFYRARAENKKALDDANEAIRMHPATVEWYLTRSDIHERLKMPKERIAGIREGLRETGSGVLEIELVEAMLDDGQNQAALEKIEAEIKASRLQSSWLIRRARAEQALGRPEPAKTDLEAALAEIAKRLNPSSPDPMLLADKALAHELLGQKDEARKYYELARDAGGEDWVKEKIKALKAEGEAKAKEREKELEKSWNPEKKGDKEKKNHDKSR
jgi:tetratricopeptide (TPR) repeat protein